MISSDPSNNRNDVLLTKLEQVSQSARQVALFRMECLRDNDDTNDGKKTTTTTTSSSSSSSSSSGGGSFNITEGLAQELVNLLIKALEEDKEEDMEAAEEKRDNSNVSSASSPLFLLQRVLPILEDITKTDQTLAEEVARNLLCPGAGGEPSRYLERLLQVISDNVGEEEDDNLAALIRDITTRFENLVVVEDDKGAGMKASDDGSGDVAATTTSNGSFSRSELLSRLPLVFSMPQAAPRQQTQTNNIIKRREDMKIVVHQATSAEESEQHDVGLVMWPSAVMLARHIAQNPNLVLGSVNNNNNGNGTILELGAGCGLVGLTAASLVQQQHSHNEDNNNCNPNLILTDYNPQVLSNLKRNVHLNDLDGCTSVVGLDFFDQQPPNEEDDEQEKQKLEEELNSTSPLNSEDHCWIDMEGIKHPQVDLILAADVIVYSNDADLVANTIKAALNPKGGKAIVLGPDEDHRFGVQYFAEACYNCGLQVTVTNLDCCIAPATTTTTSRDSDSNQHQRQSEKQQDHLDHDLEQTSGFHQGYNLTMFTIEC